MIVVLQRQKVPFFVGRPFKDKVEKHRQKRTEVAMLYCVHLALLSEVATVAHPKRKTATPTTEGITRNFV